MSDPTGYAVLTADGHFVGIWRDRETAQKVLNRSPMAKGERIVEYSPAALRELDEAEPGRYAIVEGIQWHQVCDTSVPHVNGVGDPIARALPEMADRIARLLNAAPPAPDVEDAARLAALEQLASEMVSINAPGSHGGSADKWLVTVERRDGALPDEYEADTFRAAIDAARGERNE